MPNSPSLTVRVKDRLIEIRSPVVMGILNATPDSFHAASRVHVDAALRRAEQMLTEGAGILDVGGASTRPGAAEVDIDEELRRSLPVIEAVHRRFPDAWISIDTYRARVASEAIQLGAGLVNDVGAGTLDPEMLDTVARSGVPYIAMHMRGSPATMQQDPQYADVVGEVTLFLNQRMAAARKSGVADVFVDPGFGFGKTTEQNYTLLRGLPVVASMGAPVVVGLSRKRMINSVLGTRPEDALNGTTALHMLALLGNAAILRVHDVKEAVQVVRLHAAYLGN